MPQKNRRRNITRVSRFSRTCSLRPRAFPPAAKTSFAYQETGGIAESLAIVSPSTQAVYVLTVLNGRLNSKAIYVRSDMASIPLCEAHVPSSTVVHLLPIAGFC
jgi:hypothetical protein